jgi:hypothetical protein
MAALDFPNSPTTGQTFTANGTTWQYNNTRWEVVVTAPFTTGKAIAMSLVFGG